MQTVDDEYIHSKLQWELCSDASLTNIFFLIVSYRFSPLAADGYKCLWLLPYFTIINQFHFANNIAEKEAARWRAKFLLLLSLKGLNLSFEDDGWTCPSTCHSCNCTSLDSYFLDKFEALLSLTTVRRQLKNTRVTRVICLHAQTLIKLILILTEVV